MKGEKETHYLQAFGEGKYTVDFWKEKFDVSQSRRTNLRLLSQNANFVCMFSSSPFIY